MNLNQKISDLPRGAGLTTIKGKIRELLQTTNWLMAIRSVGGNPISESVRGPVINVTQAVSGAGDQPWLQAPNGDAGGWLAITVINPGTNQIFDAYSWCSNGHNNRVAPWLVDPNGVAAQWVQHDVCVNGQVVSKWFWGTP